MRKIGRNDPCPCGSGKKYKKCCIDKFESLLDPVEAEISQGFDMFMTYEEINSISTSGIINRLKANGIAFDKDDFLKDIERFYSAEQISEGWFKRFNVTAVGREEDFPWLAAWVLWERLAPSHILSREQISDLMDLGYGYLSEGNTIKACDIWLGVWEALKYRFKPEHLNMGYLDKQYKGTFFIRNFVQDLEMELARAGEIDKTYYLKRIEYCREFIHHFPEEDTLIIHNMRRAVGDSYLELGDYERAELEFTKLVQDYPNNVWSYVAWGDMYYFSDRRNLPKAMEIYKKGLLVTEGDETDKMALEERIEELIELLK